MYGCEIWAVKADCKRIDAFELWCWRRLLRVPWTVRRSNQSTLKEISPGCSLVFLSLMLRLKLQNFGHLTWRTDSFEKTVMLGKIESGKRRECQKMRWLDGITDSTDMSLLGDGEGQESLACCSPWGHRVRHNWVTELNYLLKLDLHMPYGWAILLVSIYWK